MNVRELVVGLGRAAKSGRWPRHGGARPGATRGRSGAPGRGAGRRPSRATSALGGAAIGALVTLVATLVALNGWPDRDSIAHRVAPAPPVDDGAFVRTLEGLTGAPFTAGNRVDELRNGDRIFGAMLEAIRGARHSVTFEANIFGPGEVTRAFTDALAERARAGVKVHVLLDWQGARVGAAEAEQMRRAGAEVVFFRPPRWDTIAELDHRTHRKLLVVDGRLGFVGGVAFSDQWRGDADAPDHWRDTHFEVEGPAVAHLQATFAEHWLRVSEGVLQGDAYFPALAPAGEARAQVVAVTQRAGGERARLLYLLALAAARRRVRVASSYFIPDGETSAALVAARRRGVEVEVVVPGRSADIAVARLASQTRWRELLDAGVAIYEYEATMYHCKLVIVDDALVMAGSTNLNSRSFRLDDEVNVHVLDPALASRLVEAFEADRARAVRVTAEQWARRPVGEQITQWAAGLLRSQL
ncbi:MAG TPA: phospholipase D-like domain-containing protein [Polyangiaceae bacterium]|nr:phospholipase D-like domain-containing protein [Polyangiaceae bacterium]